MTYSVRVDPDICEGHGLCVIDVPEVFEADENGLATVRVVDVPVELQEKVRACARGCPSGAIFVTD
jgi:ferredoxin